MKIIRLSTFLDFGGLEKRLINVSHIQDNHDWVFVCLNKTGYAAQEIKKQGKRVVNLEVKPSIYSFKSTYKVYQFLKSEKADVVHTSGAEANFHGVLAAKLAGINHIIAEEIGIPNHSRLGRLAFKNIYKLAHRVIGNSYQVLNILKDRYHVNEKKLYQVPNPIIFEPLEDYNHTFLPENAIHIISISRLTKVKNLSAVIQVVAKLIQENYPIYYHIYGEGEEKASLQQLILEEKVEPHVFLHGFEPNPLKPLKAADIFILNSYTEGFSNALCEAMYAKTMAISTDSGAASEMIEHKVTGFIIPVDDSKALRNQILDIISMDANQKLTIGDRANQKVKANYSLDTHAQTLYKIYTS